MPASDSNSGLVVWETREREDCLANGSVKRNLFSLLIDKYFAEKIHCKDLSLKYLAPDKALFSFPAPGSGNPVMTT